MAVISNMRKDAIFKIKTLSKYFKVLLAMSKKEINCNVYIFFCLGQKYFGNTTKNIPHKCSFERFYRTS